MYEMSTDWTAYSRPRDLVLAMMNGGVAAFGQKEEVLRKVLRPNVVPVINNKVRQQNEREEAAS